jgi:hypothetical protein
MDNLKEHKKIEESTETLFSIIIHNKKVLDVIKFFEDQLEKAKKINNVIKKNKINNRLFNFIKYINDTFNDENIIINNIFLIHDKIINYKLNNNEINIAITYNFLNIFLKTDTYFYIDYFIDLFYNFNFIYTIKINKNDMYIIKLNKNKEKELESIKLSNENKILEEIDKIKKIHNYKEIIIIHGVSPFISKIDNKIKNIIIEKDFCNRDTLYTIYENEIMKKNHELLEKKINDMQNEKCNLDLYVFGKLKLEIKDAIESYLLKELYIEDKKLDKLKTFIDESYLNFTIIPIKSLVNGDIGDIFIKNYNGIIGIKYY